MARPHLCSICAVYAEKLSEKLQISFRGRHFMLGDLKSALSNGNSDPGNIANHPRKHQFRPRKHQFRARKRDHPTPEMATSSPETAFTSRKTSSATPKNC